MRFTNINELIGTNVGELPVVIPTFNNPSYLKLMLKQLEDYKLTNIVILDNNSTFEPMLSFLNSVSEKYRVVKKNTNDGPREFYLNRSIFNWLPQFFIVTDPDIKFNPSLPDNFVSVLKMISERHRLYKVGFALDIEMSGINSNINEILFDNRTSMKSWEHQFWVHRLHPINGIPIFRAAVDTTFCLVNKAFYTPHSCPMEVEKQCGRVGGNYLAQHYGWFKYPPISKEESDFYLKSIPKEYSHSGNAIKQKVGEKVEEPRKKLSILICSLHSRKSYLDRLLSTLCPQVDLAIVEVLYDIDNGEVPIGSKRNALISRVNGEYLCFVDDDDLVSNDYVSKILKAIESGPDCVGMEGIMTTNGADPRKFIHSLKYDHWFEEGGIYYRNPNHLNPIKTEIVRKVPFEGISMGEDASFSMSVRNFLKTEVYIDGPIYFYEFRPKVAVPQPVHNYRTGRRR